MSKKEAALKEALGQERYERFQAIVQRWNNSSTGNWLLESDKTRFGENWLIADLGHSIEDGKDYFITTDNVRASEYDGDAKADGELIINAKPDIAWMGNLIIELAGGLDEDAQASE